MRQRRLPNYEKRAYCRHHGAYPLNVRYRGQSYAGACADCKPDWAPSCRRGIDDYIRREAARPRASLAALRHVDAVLREAYGTRWRVRFEKLVPDSPPTGLLTEDGDDWAKELAGIPADALQHALADLVRAAAAGLGVPAPSVYHVLAAANEYTPQGREAT